MVSIEVYPEGSCSGTLIGGRLIATALHCFSGGRSPERVGDDHRHVLDYGHQADFDREYAPNSAVYLSRLGDWSDFGRAPDFAVIGLRGDAYPGRDVFPIATGADLPRPDPAVMAGLVGEIVTIVGFSDHNDQDQPLRRETQMRIANGGFRHTIGGNQPMLGFLLEALGPNAACGGDSGGSVIRKGKLIGVISGGHCTPGAHVIASFIDPHVIARADTDGDGVINEEDNCPNAPNADQVRSDRTAGATLGDACNTQVSLTSIVEFDPEFVPDTTAGDWINPAVRDPLPLLAGSIVKGSTPIPGAGAVVWGESSPVYTMPYRATGFTSGGLTKSHLADAEYCSCAYVRKDASNNDIEVVEVDAAQCNSSQLCPGDGLPGVPDPLRALGWRRLTWQRPKADGTYEICPQDSSGLCATKPDLTHRRLFDAPVPGCSGGELGCRLGDYSRYWQTPGRTQLLSWDYTAEDYPHLLGQTYDRTLTGSERVRARLYPEGVVDINGHKTNGFTTAPQELNHGQPWVRLLRPLYQLPFAWRVPLLIDPWRFSALGQQPEIGLFAPIQPGTEIPDELEWAQPGGATSALLLTPINALSQRLGPVRGCQRTSVSSLATVGGALAQDGPWLFSYGGVDAGGEATAGLSVARVDGVAPNWQSAATTPSELASWRTEQGLGESAAAWETLTSQLIGLGNASFVAAPAINDGALIADLKQNRVALLFAQDAQGALSFHLRDLSSSAWLQVETPAFLRRRRVGAAPHPQGSSVLFYGGLAENGEELGGLYQLSLDPTSWPSADADHARLDAGQQQTPGVRVGAALAVDRTGRYVYLYGGTQGGQPLGDLWRYTIATGAWDLLSDGSQSGAPKPMASAHLLVSRIDGSVVVVSGTPDTDPDNQQRAYRFREGHWWTEGL